jgi:hypothetical protein
MLKNDPLAPLTEQEFFASLILNKTVMFYIAGGNDGGGTFIVGKRWFKRIAYDPNKQDKTIEVYISKEPEQILFLLNDKEASETYLDTHSLFKNYWGCM